MHVENPNPFFSKDELVNRFISLLIQDSTNTPEQRIMFLNKFMEDTNHTPEQRIMFLNRLMEDPTGSVTKEEFFVQFVVSTIQNTFTSQEQRFATMGRIMQSISSSHGSQTSTTVSPH